MMEKLTQDLADKAWAIIEEVEAMGGMTKAVESGWAKLQDRGVRRREAGADRLGQGRDRRREQVPARARKSRSRSARSTTRPCASRRSRG